MGAVRMVMQRMKQKQSDRCRLVSPGGNNSMNTVTGNVLGGKESVGYSCAKRDTKERQRNPV